MRELTKSEVMQVSGGALSFREAGIAILGISSFTLPTAAFGYPIAGALLYLDYVSDN